MAKQKTRASDLLAKLDRTLGAPSPISTEPKPTPTEPETPEVSEVVEVPAGHSEPVLHDVAEVAPREPDAEERGEAAGAVAPPAPRPEEVETPWRAPETVTPAEPMVGGAAEGAAEGPAEEAAPTETPAEAPPHSEAPTRRRAGRKKDKKLRRLPAPEDSTRFSLDLERAKHRDFKQFALFEAEIDASVVGRVLVDLLLEEPELRERVVARVGKMKEEYLEELGRADEEEG